MRGLSHCPHRKLHRISVATALLFGLVTIVAGSRILLGGADPGYVVVRPVLVFNTLMGAAYVAVALILRSSLARGRVGAALIAVANMGTLAALAVHRAAGGFVADETIAAMVLRTGVWVGIWAAASWMMRAPDAAA